MKPTITPKGTGFAYPIHGEPLKETLKKRDIKGYYDIHGNWVPLTDEEKRRIINGK